MSTPSGNTDEKKIAPDPKGTRAPSSSSSSTQRRTNKEEDLRFVEEGRHHENDGADPTDQASETEGTHEQDHDHSSPPKPHSTSVHPPPSSSLQREDEKSKRTRQFLIMLVCCTLFLVAIGTLLGVLLPRNLRDNDNENKGTKNNTSNTTQEEGFQPQPPSDGNTTTTSITTASYNYTSLDPPDDRNGGFYADPLGEALHDGFTAVLKGGLILAWEQSPAEEPAGENNSTKNNVHRVVLDLKVPHAISEVAVYGVLLERWGLNAPVSLRLQLFGDDSQDTTDDGSDENSSIYDSLLLTPDDIDDAWVATFMPSVPLGSRSGGKRLATRVFLDVTCPTSEARVGNKNMRCGISEVDLVV